MGSLCVSSVVTMELSELQFLKKHHFHFQIPQTRVNWYIWMNNCTPKTMNSIIFPFLIINGNILGILHVITYGIRSQPYAHKYQKGWNSAQLINIGCG